MTVWSNWPFFPLSGLFLDVDLYFRLHHTRQNSRPMGKGGRCGLRGLLGGKTHLPLGQQLQRKIPQVAFSFLKLFFVCPHHRFVLPVKQLPCVMVSYRNWLLYPKPSDRVTKALVRGQPGACVDLLSL